MRDKKPHAVCIPYPAQGHMTPLLNLAKLLHSKFGFHITFVNTDHNHNRLLRTTTLDVLPSFRFKAIPDGLSVSNPDATQDIPSLSLGMAKPCHQPFKDLLTSLNVEEGSPIVSLIVSDCAVNFSFDASQEMGIPLVNFWTASACAFLGYAQYRRLVDQDIVPIKDGNLKRVVDWIPSMKGICLKDLPSFVRTSNKDDILFNVLMERAERMCNSNVPTIFHTYYALEQEVLDDISTIFRSPIYSIGPLQLQLQQSKHDDELNLVKSNLWKEDLSCLQWLDSKAPKSILYINFGSVMMINQQDIDEIAWGLLNSNQNFLLITRPNLINGECTMLPLDFITRTKGRGFIANWCDQKCVLSHISIGGFLTHCGWNSILESISNGVPVICWPFFADQMTNSWFCCEKWEIGLQMDENVKRDHVEYLVREMIVGEKGKDMRKRAMEWKMLAKEGTLNSGSSFLNLDKLFNKVLHYDFIVGANR